MKKIGYSVCPMPIMASSPNQPVLARLQAPGMWKPDRNASHEALR